MTVAAGEPLAAARDRMLAHGYNQLVVVDGHGQLLDLLTERDIVGGEARADRDDADAPPRVGDAIAARCRPAVATLSTDASIAEAVDALRGEPPRGIVTRGDVPQLL